jgi:3-hydroxybutyryl-CoA dehydrogenase
VQAPKIGVIGAGTTGCGIARLAAANGIEVILVDVETQKPVEAIDAVLSRLVQMVSKEGMSEGEGRAALNRISHSTQYDQLKNADIVIEAAGESYEQKRKVLEQIDRSIDPATIISSITSSISVNKLASLISHAHRFVGMHFFNPTSPIALVEIIRGFRTSDSTHAVIVALVERLGQPSITVKNTPGSVVNRILFPMINEAFFLLDEGDVSAASIDDAMKLGCNLPIGPLALADMIGLDVVLATIQMLNRELDGTKYYPCPLLEEMVSEGRLGRKCGRGVYDYPSHQS